MDIRQGAVSITAVFDSVENLLSYGVQNQLMDQYDVIPVCNAVCELLAIGPVREITIQKKKVSLAEVLSQLTQYMLSKQKIEDTMNAQELFQTKLMGFLMPRASEVVRSFREHCKESPQKATDYFFAMSVAANYVKLNEAGKNKNWQAMTAFGDLEITINLSKPEKDPRDIAAARNKAPSHYPKCLLCVENVGYQGRADHPARQNLRVVPVNLDGEEWFLQYSPYLYYNEHCIVLDRKHRPMQINCNSFRRLLSFVDQFPHYFIGSNADLPVVGGSILSHDHFQGGRHSFPMEKAQIYQLYDHINYPAVEIGLVYWPLSTIRLKGTEPGQLIDLADHILKHWRNYSDPEAEILSHTNDMPHSTITPIARKKDGVYELDLVLRNNRASDEHPLGIFHPHAEVHHIKKENIGLIEVLGLAILPGRLDSELAEISQYLCKPLSVSKICEQGAIGKHKQWVEYLVQHYGQSNSPEHADQILKNEIGSIFTKVLWDCGVFKMDEDGKVAFQRFIASAGFRLKGMES